MSTELFLSRGLCVCVLFASGADGVRLRRPDSATIRNSSAAVGSIVSRRLFKSVPCLIPGRLPGRAEVYLNRRDIDARKRLILAREVDPRSVRCWEEVPPLPPLPSTPYPSPAPQRRGEGIALVLPPPPPRGTLSQSTLLAFSVERLVKQWRGEQL